MNLAKAQAFAGVLKVFRTATALADLGKQVNGFREQSDVPKVVSRSDARTKNSDGATMSVK